MGIKGAGMVARAPEQSQKEKGKRKKEETERTARAFLLPFTFFLLTFFPRAGYLVVP
ncbi:MAG TPA: hypothetical protein VJT74_06695 [Pyrinomonadaceae bacterium]|nr:hypothetical protein [Pyrinomonadaceae bacterium]